MNLQLVSPTPRSARPRAATAALLLLAAAFAGCTVDLTAGSERPLTSAAPRWTTPAEQALPPSTADAMQAALETYLQTQDAPGATAAVVTRDGAWAGAAGVDAVGAELEPESAFAIASITKTFVAAEVLLLSAHGQVDLDVDVAEYVELPFTSDGATVREVLGMESGFPLDPVEQVVGMTGDLDREWAVDDVFDLVQVGSIQGVHGGDPDYNNLNYWALGALVEEVTGQSLADAVRQDLLDPLGLERVWVQGEEHPGPRWRSPWTIPASPRSTWTGRTCPHERSPRRRAPPGGWLRTRPPWPGGGTCCTAARSSTARWWRR